MDLNNLIIVFILGILSFCFYYYFSLILKKYNKNILLDDQLDKPQAFHEFPVATIGGIGIFVSFLITWFYFSLFKNLFFIDYLSFCFLFFLLGFVDDIKINISPKKRLFLMILFLALLVKYNNFYIDNTGISYLNNWLKHSEIFSLIFVCLCFLFVINGANLIDGFNGLLGIHSLIILLNLFVINLLNNNSLSELLILNFFVILIFLFFNFPKAKIFLGDGGSYFLGAFIALSTINTSIENPNISPFYFCILLFYLFFEVFFSFFRKLLKEKISPIRPDDKHLHMLLYKYLFKSNKDKIKSNYTVSIIINLIYFFLIIPAILFMENGLFCKYYSILLFAIYIFSYAKLHRKNL
jgi:UDP-GlcNAc:undecaprenyl-phosphate/decaprenyl-phosphate GlcNAc-1-phosphate transferase